MELGGEVGQLRLLDRRPDQDAAQAVPDEADLADVEVGGLQVVHDLVHKFPSHVLKALECVHLVDLGHEELQAGTGEAHLQVSLHQAKVGAVPVKSVHTDDKVRRLWFRVRIPLEVRSGGDGGSKGGIEGAWKACQPCELVSISEKLDGSRSV